ncbi:MAG: SdrD B-like domain-containing protein, partial [Candidatus Hodarchaeales archaeon]
VPAGDITLQVRRYPELGSGAFALKNVTFNSATNPELSSITDDEAMRRGGDYNRLVNISIDPANIEGYVYFNKDANDVYNESVDESLSGATVVLVGIDQMDPSTGQPVRYDYGMYRELTTDEKGYYNASSLIPGYYRITTGDPDGFLIDDALIMLYSGNASHNISKPKPGAIEGNIYFDENENSQYDVGEEMSNAVVRLQYTKLTTGLEVIDSLTTDETGRYSFSSLAPGRYTINATKLPDYEVEIEATIPENDTAVLNVSIGYARVSLSGSTKDKDKGTTVSNISIDFLPEYSVVNNTAQSSTAKSDETGTYSAVLMPGSYNVTVNQVVNESGTNVTYTYSSQLEVQIGEITKIFDILMTKE